MTGTQRRRRRLDAHRRWRDRDREHYRALGRGAMRRLRARRKAGAR